MMRALFLIGCLLVSVNVFAQTRKRDTFYNDPAKKKFIMRSASNDNNRSYVTIDGKVYTGLLDSLNTDNIEKFSVMKSGDAVTLFGEKGKNGAILITMKQRAFPVEPIIELRRLEKDITNYVLDGKLSTRATIDALNRKDIVDVAVLKYDKKSVPEEFKGKVTLAVTTRAFAVKQYRKKLSELSNDYKTYLDKHNQDDSGLTFIIDGGLISPTLRENLQMLYKLSTENIKNISFDKRRKNLTGYKPALSITTK